MENIGKLNGLIHFIEEFRKFHPEVQAQTIASFLYIAAWKEQNPHEPVYVKDVAEAVGVPSATASRNVTLLGKGVRTVKGMGLIDAREDPMFRTRKLIELTPKGRTVLRTILERMQ